jgi:BirA family biotin operon repressor/biotin-[acetyl-CoA-carboxylase] ligase
MIWPAEDIWQSCVPLLPALTVEVLKEVDSTNSELMRRARAGQTDPVLLVAESQTAGAAVWVANGMLKQAMP